MSKVPNNLDYKYSKKNKTWRVKTNSLFKLFYSFETTTQTSDKEVPGSSSKNTWYNSKSHIGNLFIL